MFSEIHLLSYFEKVEISPVAISKNRKEVQLSSEDDLFLSRNGDVSALQLLRWPRGRRGEEILIM